MSSLTPDAKAYYKTDFGGKVVTIAPDQEGFKNHVVLDEGNGCVSIVHRSLVTPLLSAVITDEGKAKERNSLGDAFTEKEPAMFGPIGGVPDEWSVWNTKRRAWYDAEASRRTWEVEDTKVDHGDAWVMASFLGPCTPVLGYEKEGKFVIVEIVK